MQLLLERGATTSPSENPWKVEHRLKRNLTTVAVGGVVFFETCDDNFDMLWQCETSLVNCGKNLNARSVFFSISPRLFDILWNVADKAALNCTHVSCEQTVLVPTRTRPGSAIFFLVVQRHVASSFW